jgi:hypothetical protein
MIMPVITIVLEEEKTYKAWPAYVPQKKALPFRREDFFKEKEPIDQPKQKNELKFDFKELPQ